MRKKISVDKETATCRITAADKHPNRKNKRLHRYKININKLDETINDIREGRFQEKDLSRSILMSPTKADDAWFETYFFDVDYPSDNSISPKSEILEIPYIEDSGKKKKLEIYFDGHNPEIGFIYWFPVQNKEDARYLLLYVEKFFLDETIMIFGAEYRDANDHDWKPLKEDDSVTSLS